MNGLILSPEDDCLCDKEISLDEVRSEGLRQWNMDMDVEYQYETFNGLPVYYGGDMYDLEDSEECDPPEMARAAYVEDYNFDVLEGMELMTYTRRRLDGGEARGVNTVDMVPMCQTVSCVTRIEPEESSDPSGTDATVIEGSDIEDFCLWPDLLDEEDCSLSNVGSSVDNSLCMTDILVILSEDSYEDIGFNLDEGSVAELEWNTWDEECALEFQNASGVFPPNSTVVHPAVNLKDNVYHMEEAPVLEPLEHLVLKKPLDSGSLEGRSVVDWFAQLIMEPLEHSVLATASVWEPLEHSNCVVTDHVNCLDAGGTLGDCCRPRVTSWRTVFRLVARLSCRPTFVDEDCSRLFRSLRRMCVLDIHVGQTDVPTGSPGDVSCCPSWSL